MDEAFINKDEFTDDEKYSILKDVSNLNIILPPWLGEIMVEFYNDISQEKRDELDRVGKLKEMHREEELKTSREFLRKFHDIINS